MDGVESPLEVLSRAATMVQHCRSYPSSDCDGFESPSTGSSGESEGDRTLSPEAEVGIGRAGPQAKELPTAKWRRERRSCRLPNYNPRDSSKSALRSQSFNERRINPRIVPTRILQPHSDGELSDESEGTSGGRDCVDSRGAPPEYPGNGEAPIDMRLRSRPSPPPYPHPRPSVIRSAEPQAPAPPVLTLPTTGSMSMCDPVIDEHFRRSLGDNYMALFSKKSQEQPQPGPKPNTKDRGSSPIMFASDPCTNFLKNTKADPKTDAKEESFEDSKVNAENLTTHDDASKIQQSQETKIDSNTKDIDTICMEVDDASISVDDHFAKALGDTWRKIQSSRLIDSKSEEKPKEGNSKIISRRGVVI